MFRNITPCLYEIHIAMLRGARDVKAFVITCLDEMKKRGASKFIGLIGDWNKPAIRLAKHCGFKEHGKIDHAYMRDGQYRDMVIMGG
jgi:L-amino acid N-acyltransferase YncA